MSAMLYISRVACLSCFMGHIWSSFFTMSDTDFANVARAVFLAGCVFLVSRWVYRLTLHPIANIPGPRLAALSSIYAMTWDWRHKSYIKNFKKWHDEYGPVVRIEPNHIHILDIEAYNKVFSIGTKFQRDPRLYKIETLKEGFFPKLHVRDAKPHKDLYQPYFSRAAVSRLEPIIREHLTIFLDRISSMAQKGETIDLSRGFTSLTADTIMRYSYDRPFGALNQPGFVHPILELSEEALAITATQLGYVPNLAGVFLKLMSSLPRSWLSFNPPLQSILDQVDDARARIQELREKPPSAESPSVFQGALSKLSDQALTADAITFFIAGTDTTAHTLVVCFWHLLRNPEMLRTLRAELDAAIAELPDLTPRLKPSLTLDWPALEALPYLTAVIKESLRLSYGVPGKLPRVVPADGAELAGRFIPGGTTISMSCHTYHHNPAFYRDDPDIFLPERWLRQEGDDGKARDEEPLISFSRGSRGCLGQNLAYAELHYTIAYLLRCFELEVVETTEHDMDWHDAFVVATYGHLKVTAKRREA
jgi:cytochrome P450